MNLELDAEQLDLQSSIRRFLQQRVEPIIDQHEQQRTFPFEVLSDLAPFGYFGGWLPEEQGGMGIDRATWAMMMEELGYCWGSLRTLVNISNGPIARLAAHGSESQRDRYLPDLLAGKAKVFSGITEPQGGSNVAGATSRAELDGDEWVLNAHKIWITGGAWADFGIVVARTYSPDCDGDLSLFLVDRAESAYDVSPIDLMVLRCTGTAELKFTDVRIPKANLIGEQGGALRSTLEGLSTARLNVAMGAVGAAQRAYDLSVEYAKSRSVFGKPIGSFQLVQKRLVDMRMKIDAARALGYRAAAVIDSGGDTRLSGSIAKLYATEISHEVASNALEIHGALGYAGSYPIERIFRDTRGGTIPEGTSDIQTLIIGREILGISAIS